MAKQPSANKEFSVHRVQFLIQQTLFPTSADLPPKSEFMRTVLEDSARSARYRSGQKKWVITHPRIVDMIEGAYLVGTLGYIKDRPANVYDYEKLEFKTERTKDAELLRFVFDGERELVAIQTSPAFTDGHVLEMFEQLFAMANPEIRKNRVLAIYPVTSGSNLIAQVYEEPVRRFIAEIRRPNAKLSGQFDKYFAPLQAENNSDRVEVTWWSKAENLFENAGGALKAAVGVAEGGFGSWIAWVRTKSGKLQKICSSESSMRRILNADTDETLAATASTTFREIDAKVEDSD